MTILLEATRVDTGATSHRAFPITADFAKRRLDLLKRAVREGFKEKQQIDVILTAVIDLDSGEVIYHRDPQTN